jgi:hypothetical protein
MNISIHILNNSAESLHSCPHLKSPTLPPSAWGNPLVWKLLHSYFKISAAAFSTFLHQVVPLRFLIQLYQVLNSELFTIKGLIPSQLITQLNSHFLYSCKHLLSLLKGHKDMCDTFRHNILHATTIKLEVTSPHVTLMLLSAFLTLVLSKISLKWVCLHQH